MPPIIVEMNDSDIFTSDAKAIVNPVNCVGVMGKGLALAFKKKFPNNFKNYAKGCQTGFIEIGKVFVIEESNKWVVNFPTKDHWKDSSNIEWIKDGLDSLDAWLKASGCPSIAIPAIGCGLGGLGWKEVRESILETAKKNPEVIFFLYPPK